MTHRQPQFRVDEGSVPTSEIKHLVRQWLFDCECQGHTSRTIASRRIYTKNLIWFLENKGYEECDARAMREFTNYVRAANPNRWGTTAKIQVRNTRQSSPATVQSYHNNLTAFFSWAVREGVIEGSPMARLRPPLARLTPIQPFTMSQVDALLKASQRSIYAKRDHALLMLLLDTGLRTSEVCGITGGDIEIMDYRVTVWGKGNKRRTVPFGRDTARAMQGYIRYKKSKCYEYEEREAFFVSESGRTPGQGMQRNGIYDIVERLGKDARITGVRCSPHTCRHTFAVSFLRNGGNLFTLQQILGHEDLKMTRRYVTFTQADIEGAGREFSPMDAMRKKQR